MKNLKKVFYLLLVAVLLVPYVTYAKDEKYSSLNLTEALAVEEIEQEYETLEENEDQAIVYLFRRDGCYYCRQFLTYMNSLVNEYGKYFKVVSYEVSGNQNNAELFNEVSTYLDGEAADGVPYIVIGDKKFAGYAEEYNEAILSAIQELYETPKDERYDVIDKVTNKPNYDNVVAVVSVLVIAGLVTVAVITRRANKED